MNILKVLKRSVKEVFRGNFYTYSTGVNTITVEARDHENNLLHIELSREEIKSLLNQMDLMKEQMENHYKTKIEV